ATALDAPEWLQQEGSINDIAFSADGARIATASDNGTIVLWASSNRQRTAVIREASTVLALRFDDTGDRLLTVTGTGTSVWDVKTGRLERMLPPGGAWAFSERKQFGIFQDARANVWRAWDFRSARITGAFQLPSVRTVSIDPDGSRVATSDMGAAVRVW